MRKAKKSTVGAPANVDGALLEAAPVRAKRESGPGKPHGLVDDFGTRPAGVTHWRCYRVSDDGTRAALPLEYESSTSEMGVSRFPITELVPSVIRKRWGGGVYSVEFLGPRPGKGTCIHLAWGQKVTIGDRARRAAPEPPASVVPVPPPVDPFAMMNIARQTAREEADHIRMRVNQDLNGLAQLAAVLAGNQQASQAIMAQQQNAQLAAELAQVRAELAAMRAADEDDEEEDDEEEEDEDEDGDDEEEEEEESLLEKGMRLFQEYGPALQAAMQFLSQNPNALNGATSTPAAAAQPQEPRQNAT